MTNSQQKQFRVSLAHGLSGFSPSWWGGAVELMVVGILAGVPHILVDQEAGNLEVEVGPEYNPQGLPT